MEATVAVVVVEVISTVVVDKVAGAWPSLKPPVTSNFSRGVVVPIPTLPPKLTIPVPCWVIVLWKVAAPPKLEVPETVRLVELAGPGG